MLHLAFRRSLLNVTSCKLSSSIVLDGNNSVIIKPTFCIRVFLGLIKGKAVKRHQTQVQNLEKLQIFCMFSLWWDNKDKSGWNLQFLKFKLKVWFDDFKSTEVKSASLSEHWLVQMPNQHLEFSLNKWPSMDYVWEYTSSNDFGTIWSFMSLLITGKRCISAFTCQYLHTCVHVVSVSVFSFSIKSQSAQTKRKTDIY